MEFDKAKIIRVDRVSPVDMKYSVRTIGGLKPEQMYRFDTKKEAMECAKALKAYIKEQYEKVSKSEQEKFWNMVNEFKYENVSQYEYLKEKKGDIFLEYI